jgi:hypothetical protein
MSVQGPFKVDCGELFPQGLGIISEVDSLDDFDKSTKDNRVQARDKDTGLPMWSVEVLDFDRKAREKTFGSRSRLRCSRSRRMRFRVLRCVQWCWTG